MFEFITVLIMLLYEASEQCLELPTDSKVFGGLKECILVSCVL